MNPRARKPANGRLYELHVTGVGRDQHIVARAGEEILLGRTADCQIMVDHTCAAACLARLFWKSAVAPTLDPLGLNGAGDNALRLDGEPVTVPTVVTERQSITLAGVAIAWRWLPLEECPTLPASRIVGDNTANRLAQEIK
ncbi:MAG: hypothetical protein ACREP1_07305, partial [Rhodanobacteraceae bacterium]